ncbi:hypothetical protein [Streptomyces albidus (ex Kaewkla and Franco 2022)]|nr:hypothetical protein [Streptomyces albidus (ex Kaewkla and Franco 2022)]
MPQRSRRTADRGLPTERFTRLGLAGLLGDAGQDGEAPGGEIRRGTL